MHYFITRRSKGHWILPKYLLVTSASLQEITIFVGVSRVTGDKMENLSFRPLLDLTKINIRELSMSAFILLNFKEIVGAVIVEDTSIPTGKGKAVLVQG